MHGHIKCVHRLVEAGAPVDVQIEVWQLVVSSCSNFVCWRSTGKSGITRMWLPLLIRHISIVYLACDLHKKVLQKLTCLTGFGGYWHMRVIPDFPVDGHIIYFYIQDGCTALYVVASSPRTSSPVNWWSRTCSKWLSYSKQSWPQPLNLDSMCF